MRLLTRWEAVGLYIIIRVALLAAEKALGWNIEDVVSLTTIVAFAYIFIGPEIRREIS